MYVIKGYDLFCSRLNAMCLKKHYNGINVYLALILAFVLIVMVKVITKSAISTSKSQYWQAMEGNDQQLHNVHIHFVIDATDESINIFSEFGEKLRGTMRKHLQKMCQNCIATSQEPEEFFKSMPYELIKPIQNKYLLSEGGTKKEKLFSFTYAAAHFEQTKRYQQQPTRSNKTLTIYYNAEILHSSFRSLNFGHNLALLCVCFILP